MQLNPSEISDLIKDRIKNFEASTEARNEGTIVSLADGIVRIHGLDDAMLGEMLEFPGDRWVKACWAAWLIRWAAPLTARATSTAMAPARLKRLPLA